MWRSKSHRGTRMGEAGRGREHLTRLGVFLSNRRYSIRGEGTMKRILFITIAAAFVLSACGAAATVAPDVYYESIPSSGGAPMEAPASVAQEGFADDRSTTNVQAAAIE